MEANGSKSGPVPPRNAETVAHPKPPVHPPVPPPRRRGEMVLPPLETQLQQPPVGFRAVQPVSSISLPASPGSSFGVLTPTAAATTDSADLRRQAMANAARGPHRLAGQDTGSNSVRFTQPDRDREAMMFRSQPIPRPPPASTAGRASRAGGAAMNWHADRRYDLFKTWSGKLERQITHLAGGTADDLDNDDVGNVIGSHSHRSHATSVPEVDRFYAALEGPELDQLKPSEDLVLPSNTTWPFLLRFQISAFGIPMGVSSQAILWKVITLSVPTTFLHVTSKANLVLWCVSAALMAAVSATYACKVALYFEAVRREYYHPIRVNFFFAPWITCLYLAIGVPHAVTSAARLPHWLWYVLMAPLLCLGLKIYGQWMSGGQRRLSKVANPSNHLSLLGNFVGARHHGPQGGSPILLRRRARALRSALRDTVPAAADQRDAAQGAPPGVLPLRGGAQRVVGGVVQDHRRVRHALQGGLLRGDVPVRVAGRADQLLPRLQVLAGVVGVHVADGRRGGRGDPLLDRGGQRLHQGAVRRAVRGGHAHGGGAPRHNRRARLRAPEPLPQRHLHRHHRAQGEAHHGAAGE